MQTLLRCLYSPKVCANVKKTQTLAAIALFVHTKVLHALMGMGSAALAAAVLHKATRISRKGQRSTEREKREKKGKTSICQDDKDSRICILAWSGDLLICLDIAS